MVEEVILVNEEDNRIGVEAKLEAHKAGELHRAFSIFIFNSKGELLLQKRAEGKYHSGGLWSNTCCSHPEPGEKPKEAAKRRLKEEMGFTCELKKAFSFIYKAEVGDLVEHEFDHVFIGEFDREPKPDPQEVSDWKWVDLKELKKDLKKNPERYTPWFKTCFERVLKYYNAGISPC